MNANSAIARFAIVASPRTARRSLRCSRSPTYSLPAGHSRPHDEDGGESLPAEGRHSAGTWINDENPAPPSTDCEKVTLLRGSLVDVVKAPAGANLGQGKPDHPDLFIFFTFASVASIDAANSRIAFASRSAASLASFLGQLPWRPEIARREARNFCLRTMTSVAFPTEKPAGLRRR